MALTYKPVSIDRNAFLFCRFGVALLLWATFFTHNHAYITIAFFIFIFSAILGISKAPMIVFYNWTFGTLIKKKNEMLDINDMRFIHTLAAVFSFIVLGLFFLKLDIAAYSTLFVFSILKTFSAFGYCPASKLRKCVLGGSSGCCSVSKIINKKC